MGIMKSDGQKAPEERGKAIVYCGSCNLPKAACRCKGPTGAPAGGKGDDKLQTTVSKPEESSITSKVKDSGFQDLILNLYHILYPNENLFNDARKPSNIETLSQEGVSTLIEQFLRIDKLKLKFELGQLEKLIRLLEYLKLNNQHPETKSLIEKLEHKLREYLKLQPQDVQSKYASLLTENEPEKLNNHKRYTPFGMKMKLTPPGSRSS